MKSTILIITFTYMLSFFKDNEQNLYILYNDCSIHEISKINTDTLDYEIYQIRFGDKIKPEIKFSVSESGSLNKEIRISGKNYPHLSIVYLNRNNNNPPIKINTEKMKNSIYSENIVHAVNTDFSSFFKKFDTIYLVDFNDKTAGAKVAKKVEVTFIPAL